MDRNKLKFGGRLARAALAAMLWAAPCLAAEYFVAPRGNDQDSGTSPDRPLQTIARGVKLLKPGDILTVQPGVYPESVRCVLEGRPGAPIVIRAARPGTVCLEGFTNAPPFAAAPGLRYTYQAGMAVPAHAIVMDRRLGRRLRACPDRGAVEQVLGSFCADEAAGLLYVHTSDSRAPAPGDILVSIREEGLYFAAERGRAARWLVVEGLEVRGFSGENRKFYGHGLAFENAEDVIVRDCAVHDCDHGIWFRRGGRRVKLLDNTVCRCGCLHLESGNIKFHGSNTYDSIAAGNRVFDTETHGLRTYSGGGPGTVFESNIVWNCQNSAIQFKGGKPGAARYNICSGYSDYLGVEHGNTVFGEPYARGMRDPSDLFFGEFEDERCIRDPKFVDPLNWDFRLQSDSPARGRGPGGSDLGACPYRGDVFFVSPAGDDRAEGASLTTSWKTLARAATAARPGQTVLICAGDYAEPLVPAVSGTAAAPIVFRRRGGDRVRLTGGGVLPFGADLRGRSFIRLEGFEISDFQTAGIGAGGPGCAGIEIVRCVAHNNWGAGILLAGGGVSVQQCTLAANAASGLTLESGTGEVSVTSCILALNRGGQLSAASAAPALFSDYNNIWGAAQPLAQWERKPVATLADWQRVSGQDRFSQSGDPLFAAWQERDFRLRDGSPCAAGGMAWRDQGGAARLPTGSNRVARLAVTGVTPATATVSWWTENVEGNTKLEWGPTRELGRTIFRRFEHGLFHHVTLADLAPDTVYYFRVSSQSPGWLMHGNPVLWAREENMQREEIRSEIVEFRTAAAWRRERTWHVAPQGRDENDGLSPEGAFGRIARAAELALPGDTVLIAPGHYAETIMPLHSGLPGRPITFKSSGSGPVVIDGRFIQPAMVALLGKGHIILEGFHFKRHLYYQYRGYFDGAAYSAQVWLDQARDIVIRRCFFDGRGSYTQTGIGGGKEANSSVTVEDCAFLGLSKAAGFSDSRCEFNHCVFGMCFFGHVRGRENASFAFRNCVFTSAIEAKSSNFGWMLAAMGGAGAVQSDYNVFWYQPYDKTRWVAALNTDGGFVVNQEKAACYKREDGLRRWRAETSNDVHSIVVADPGFTAYTAALEWERQKGKMMDACENPQAPKKVEWLDDFRLSKTSPLKGRGENGADIGIRFADGGQTK